MKPATKEDIEPGMLGFLHEDVVERGFVCSSIEPPWSQHPARFCDGICRFTGNPPFTNSPPGSTMLYFKYKCNKCGRKIALCSKKRSGNS